MTIIYYVEISITIFPKHQQKLLPNKYDVAAAFVTIERI